MYVNYSIVSAHNWPWLSSLILNVDFFLYLAILFYLQILRCGTIGCNRDLKSRNIKPTADGTSYFGGPKCENAVIPRSRLKVRRRVPPLAALPRKVHKKSKCTLCTYMEPQSNAKTFDCDYEIPLSVKGHLCTKIDRTMNLSSSQSPAMMREGKGNNRRDEFDRKSD